MFLLLVLIVTTVKLFNVLVKPDQPGVLLNQNVLSFHHVAPPMTTAVTVSPSRPELPGVLPPHLVTFYQPFVLTTTTVRLNNVFVLLVKLGVHHPTLASMFHHVAPLTTTAVTVLPLRPELLGVLPLHLVTMFQLYVLTTTTVRLNNVFVPQVKPGAQPQTPASLYQHVVLLMTTVEIVLHSKMECPGVL